MESTSFRAADIRRFRDEIEDRERHAQIERLERASARLADLVARMPERPAGAGGDGPDWTAHEVLAHIAVLSKFYGTLAYRVGTGALTELDLLAQLTQRDVAGEQAAARTAPELLELARADHRRTIDWLRSASLDDLRRTFDTGLGWHLSAADVVRLTLCAHLEQHLAQLEAAC